MNTNRLEAILTLLSACLVVITALMSPIISIITSVAFLIGFSAYKLTSTPPSPIIKGVTFGAISFVIAIFIGSAIALITNIPPFSPSPSASPHPPPSSLAEQIESCIIKSDLKSRQECDLLIQSITSFDLCLEAGFPALESYPRQCLTPDGRSFTETTQDDQMTMCTMDAQTCPDGSYVGRIPPDCNFAPCPQ